MHFIYDMEQTYDPESGLSNGLNDDGNAFVATLKSKFFDFSKAANKKRFNKLFFTFYSEFLPYVIELTVNLDNELQTMTGVIVNETSRWGNDDPSDDATESALKFGDIIGRGKTNLNYPIHLIQYGKKYNIQYQLQSSGLDYAWLLKAVVLLMKIKELK